MVILQLSPEEIFEYMKRAVREVNSERLAYGHPDTEPGEAGDLLTKKQAAAFLQCSQSALDNWRRMGRLKAHKLNGKKAVRFSRADLVALASGTPEKTR